MKTIVVNGQKIKLPNDAQRMPGKPWDWYSKSQRKIYIIRRRGNQIVVQTIAGCCG